MSVTFWMPQAPLCRVAPYDDEPDYLEERPVEPFTEINMANSNAADLLGLLGGYDYTGGEWDLSELPKVQKRLMVLLNKSPEKFVAEDYIEGNFVCVGRDMDYVTRRLEDMLRLVVVAIKHQFPVVFG